MGATPPPQKFQLAIPPKTPQLPPRNANSVSDNVMYLGGVIFNSPTPPELPTDALNKRRTE